MNSWGATPWLGALGAPFEEACWEIQGQRLYWGCFGVPFWGYDQGAFERRPNGT